MLRGISSRLGELKTVLDKSMSLRQSLLINAAKNINTWRCKVRKMKAIFYTMNMFKNDNKTTIAECWVPVNEIQNIREILDKETVDKILKKKS